MNSRGISHCEKSKVKVSKIEFDLNRICNSKISPGVKFVWTK